jgi:hypothetical protein
MSEQPSSFRQAQTSKTEGKETVLKKSKSGCGCSKRGNLSTSSNKVRIQQVPSPEDTKAVIGRKKADNHPTPILKQDTPVPIESKEPSIATSNATKVSITPQPKQQNVMREQQATFRKAQTAETQGKESVLKKSTSRTSGCGCNKRTKPSMSSNKVRAPKVQSNSSNKIRIQEVTSPQNNNAVIHQEKADNQPAPILKQDTPAPTKSVSNEPSIASSNATKVSNTLHPKQPTKKQPWFKRSSWFKKNNKGL